MFLEHHDRPLQLDVTSAPLSVYAELSHYLEISVETACRFPGDEAERLVRYHRRQASRRSTAARLAAHLGVDIGLIFAACTTDGPGLLLDALERRAPLAAEQLGSITFLAS